MVQGLCLSLQRYLLLGRWRLHGKLDRIATERAEESCHPWMYFNLELFERNLFAIDRQVTLSVRFDPISFTFDVVLLIKGIWSVWADQRASIVLTLCSQYGTPFSAPDIEASR